MYVGYWIDRSIDRFGGFVGNLKIHRMYVICVKVYEIFKLTRAYAYIHTLDAFLRYSNFNKFQ